MKYYEYEYGHFFTGDVFIDGRYNEERLIPPEDVETVKEARDTPLLNERFDEVLDAFEVDDIIEHEFL